jgi:hypothetical protein
MPRGADNFLNITKSLLKAVPVKLGIPFKNIKRSVSGR